MLFEYDKKGLSELRKLAVFGDIHGDYDSLTSLFELVDPSKDGAIFLGDYADRGKNGIEVIEYVNSLIKKYPTNVIALKGNHERYDESGNPTFSPRNLISEAEEKKGGWENYFEDELKPFIEKLYHAAIIPRGSLFVHGGVSSKIKNLNDLKHPTEEIEIDIMWSDPVEGHGEHLNRRGAGVEFGEDISENVCEALEVKRIIRSHEPGKALVGPYYEHGKRVITISSTSVYGGKPFVLIIDPADALGPSYLFEPSFISRSPLKRAFLS